MSTNLMPAASADSPVAAGVLGATGVSVRLRQLRTLLNPGGAVAARLLLERGTSQRLRRLKQSAGDRVQQHRAPTRPTMRTLVLQPGSRFSWQTRPCPPPPGPLGAIGRPLAVATCDMDRPLALGATPFLPPLSVGHECVAEIVSLGSEVRLLKPGQRVVVPFQISCGNCARCQAGQTANCLAVPRSPPTVSG